MATKPTNNNNTRSNNEQLQQKQLKKKQQTKKKACQLDEESATNYRSWYLIELQSINTKNWKDISHVNAEHSVASPVQQKMNLIMEKLLLSASDTSPTGR